MEIHDPEFLDMSQKQISEVDGIKNLERLTHLFLSNNNIDKIKLNALGGLKNLNYLRIGKNQLTTTTELLDFNPKNLEEISLDIEKIAKNEIEQLKKKFGETAITLD